MKRIYEFADAAAYNAVRYAENLCQTVFERRNDGFPLKRSPGGTIPAAGWWRILLWRGTLIHNGFFVVTLTPLTLSVTLIQFRFVCSAIA
jgi:hypothetical protein